MDKKGLYSGSFDPFTNGHLDVLKQAILLFDKIYLLLAVNPEKKKRFDMILMVEAIRKTLKIEEIDNVEVILWNEIVAKFTDDKNTFIIRGIRDETDYQYEEKIARINKNRFDKRTIYFRADNADISSSTVMELYKFGEDISDLVPQPIYNLIKETYKK